jgi:hypothetical protein
VSRHPGLYHSGPAARHPRGTVAGLLAAILGAPGSPAGEPHFADAGDVTLVTLGKRVYMGSCASSRSFSSEPSPIDRAFAIGEEGLPRHALRVGDPLLVGFGVAAGRCLGLDDPLSGTGEAVIHFSELGFVIRLETKDRERNRFAPDSPLEGAGFEPSVPRLRRSWVRCRPQLCSLRRLKPTPVSSLPRSQADMLSATTLKSKNPVEFRPLSYEFDGNRNARAM